MSGSKKTVLDNGVEVLFEFTNAKINVGKSDMDDLLNDKANKKAIDSKGKIWLTTDPDVTPMLPIENGGMGSDNYWEMIGTIALGQKTLYVWECVTNY